MRRWILISACYSMLLLGQSYGQVWKFDFQNDAGPLEAGYTKVTPSTLYTAGIGYGLLSPVRSGVDGSRHRWTLFGKTLSVDDIIPSAVLTDATRDCLIGGRGPIEFQIDVPPGEYQVTLWLGDVTTPRFQIRAEINDAVVDVLRLDVNHNRGSFDQTMFGNSAPRALRVDASGGTIRIIVGPHPEGASPIAWTYLQDEDPKNPPYERTVILVPSFNAAALQALTIHPAVDPPLEMRDGVLTSAESPVDGILQDALDLFNAGRIDPSLAEFQNLTAPELRAAKAAGLFWIAGHPALLDREPELLAESESLLLQVLAELPDDHAAADLLLQVRLAKDGEHYRRLYGYAAAESSASISMGRSCSLVEQFQPEHPYFLKGQVLWLRNRGGLDPRRVTASWERAQWLAQQLDPRWGGMNPYIHLYATDQWQNDGKPWLMVDWYPLTEGGPEWARALTSNLNGWLDLFEWWSIHRQAPEGDIGGGWTDDVEIVPAFGLMAFVLEGASDICREAVVKFADGIWNSDIIDRERGYQRQYADVEHTAEPTGNILHLHPLVRFGDPEAMERLMKSAKTFSEFFLAEASESPLGHRHFKGNHMSSTKIAQNPNHRADIALNGRVAGPFPMLLWYSSNPSIESALQDWISSWVADAMRIDNGKPAGVFPNMIWVPTDGIGSPEGDWWSRQNQYGQFGAFPAYQYYLYNMTGFFYLRTGDPYFLQPFDAVQHYTDAWLRAGRPGVGSAPAAGQEDIWVGNKLRKTALGAFTNLRVGSGLQNWDDYFKQFATGYGKYLLDATDSSTIDDLGGPAQSLIDGWPYRTTEGLMTDRILVPGWANVISYYIGADIFSVFFGMPVMAVTWENTTRLFAAAVSRATPAGLDATTYLFADEPRSVTMKLWQLEQGRDYLLEAGPADGLGQAPSTIDQTVAFSLTHLGDGVAFTMPAHTVYSIRIRGVGATASAGVLLPAGETSLPIDIAVSPRDVSYDASTGEITVRVHNIGSAAAADIKVSIFEGAGSSGNMIGSDTIALLEAPVDLVPRFVDLTFPFNPDSAPVQVTVVIELEGVPEITPVNNVAIAFIGAEATDLPPPMIVRLDPIYAAPGETVQLIGRNFQPDVTVLESESATQLLSVDYLDSERLDLNVGSSLNAGPLLISVMNSDGKKSNLLPLQVFKTPTGTPGLRFAQFADGLGLYSKIILVNPSRTMDVSATVLLRNDEGQPITVDINGQTVRGQITAAIPAQGMKILATDGQGSRVAGFAIVYADAPLAGFIIFGGSEGLAGVVDGDEMDQGFVAPVETDLPEGLSTGIAIINLSEDQAILDLELLDPDGSSLATAEDLLVSGGHLARYIDQFDWTPAGGGTVGLNKFRGMLKVTSQSKIAATLLQTRTGEYATLPVVPAPHDGDSGQTLHFAQFADGISGRSQVASQINLMNRNHDHPAIVTVTIRDNEGKLMMVDLNGETITGFKEILIPPGGMRVLETDGAGAWSVGSVTAESDRSLAGVILFSGSDGAAGVAAGPVLPEGFLAAMETDIPAGASTGVAVMNLELEEVTLNIDLLGEEGGLLAGTVILMPAKGHLASFVHQFSWVPAEGVVLDMSRFRGLLRVRSTGAVSATVLLSEPGRFATIPITPR